MQLTIEIEEHKSTLFLDLLNLLKKDRMINDFHIASDKSTLSTYEQEVLDDISHISDAIKQADSKINKILVIINIL